MSAEEMLYNLMIEETKKSGWTKGVISIEQMKEEEEFKIFLSLMEKYANIKAREAAEKALKLAATMNHNSTPISDGFIEYYINTNYPNDK